MKDDLKKKVEAKVGQIKTVNRLAEQGWTSEVCKIETLQDSYLLKSSSKEKYRKWLSEEANVLEKVNKVHEIPTPKYYGFIEEEDSSNLIMSFEKGVTLTTALKAATTVSEKQSLIKSFGHFLNDFHEKEPNIIFENEDDWLENQLVKAQSYVDNGQTSGSQTLLNQLKTEKPTSVKNTMIHGDCTTDNVFVLSGEVKLFIDVAGMTIGDPRYDISLAIRGFIETPELLDSFYQGYSRFKVSKGEFQYFDQGLYEFF